MQEKLYKKAKNLLQLTFYINQQ